MPWIGSVRPSSSPSPKCAPDGLISGSSSRRTPKSASSSSSQSSVSSEQSSVRDAFVSSVACTRPPVSFQTSHVSTVPNARSAARRARGAATRASSPRSTDRGRGRCARGSAPRAAPRSARPCGGPARRSRGAPARPVVRSQSSVVSRWFVIPIARRLRVDERLLRGREHALPDLLRVVLDPAGAREVLRQLRVAAAANRQLVVDEEARRAGRPLVDGEDHRRRRPYRKRRNVHAGLLHHRNTTPLPGLHMRRIGLASALATAAVDARSPAGAAGLAQRRAWESRTTRGCAGGRARSTSG